MTWNQLESLRRLASTSRIRLEAYRESASNVNADGVDFADRRAREWNWRGVRREGLQRKI